MNYDKAMYLVYCVVVLIIIFLVTIFSSYGRQISDEPSFKMYFGWFIGLFLFNLFNILVTLIFHYFMKDLVGPKGLKGEIGDRGDAGIDAKCFCSGGSVNADDVDIGMASEVRSYQANINGGGKGSLFSTNNVPAETSATIK